MKKTVWELGGFDDAAHMADKIEWEGGLLEYFLHYESPYTFKERSPAFAKLAEAIDEIYQVLDEDGVFIND